MTRMNEARKRARLTLTLMLAMSASMAAACGDDDDSTPTPPTGDAGDAGQVTPDATVPGNPDAGLDASLDAGPDATTESDAGDSAVPPQPLTVHSAVVPGVGDLRGLAYSATGGKLYASGYVTNSGDREVALVRFNADGSLDTSFDTDGIASRNVIAVANDSGSAAGQEGSSGVVELPNGDLIVQGQARDGAGGQNIVLVKFKNTGAVDTTFGTDGVVLVDFGWKQADQASWAPPPPAMGDPVLAPNDASWGIELDRSDAQNLKVVVFGDGPAKKVASGEQRYDRDRYIVRVLASTGALDTTFADQGVYTVDIDGAKLDDGGRRGLVEADGSIVSSGYTNFGMGQNNHVNLIRLTATGAPDTAFGFGTTTPGVTKFNPFLTSGGMAEAYAAVRLSTGRYVTTGYGVSNFMGNPTMENDLVSFGLLPGRLDTAFGAEGSFAIQSEGDPNAGKGARPFRENGRDIVKLADDRTVHVGCYDDFAAFFVLTKDGALDEGFGTGGRLVGTHGLPYFKVALSADGSRVAAVTQGGTPGVLLTILNTSAI